MKKVQIQDFIDYRYLGSLQVSPCLLYTSVRLRFVPQRFQHDPIQAEQKNQIDRQRSSQRNQIVVKLLSRQRDQRAQ